MSVRHCVAVGLGASSGRVMFASYQPGSRALTLREIHHSTNSLQKVDGLDYWGVDSLEGETRRGLEKVCEQGTLIDSIGIDTWGADYILLDKQGQRVGLLISYRDDRTQGLLRHVEERLGRAEIYRRSSIQFLPFNTLYQLRAPAEQRPELVNQAAHALLIPDYFSFRLTGSLNWEYTNATTTQLVNTSSDSWDETLLNWIGVPLAWFGTSIHPGNVISHWICPQGNRTPVVVVASHDIAGAVIASPLVDRDTAYFSSGIWSPMGFESLTSYTCDVVPQANIISEGGAEGRYRVLKNIMGLRLLQRVLKEQNVSDLQGLIARTAALPACRFMIDCNDGCFINPASMSAEIQAVCRDAGQLVPESDAELARCTFDSLVLSYAWVLDELAALRGQPSSRLHVIGGGCQNALLNQLCADARGIAIVAGPMEAPTLGNIGIQLMTLDELADVDEFRQVVRDNAALTAFIPDPDSEIVRFVAQFQPRQTKEFCA